MMTYDDLCNLGNKVPAVLANDVKKGSPLFRPLGWRATMADNKRGVVRMIDAKEPIPEMGSCYIDEIQFAQIGDVWHRVILSDIQLKNMNKIRHYHAKMTL